MTNRDIMALSGSHSPLQGFLRFLGMGIGVFALLLSGAGYSQELGQAVDNTSLVWTTGGSATWASDSSVCCAGGQDRAWLDQVQLAALPCAYAISTGSAFYPSAGGNGSVGVTAGSGCAWSVSNPNAWITITSGGSGTGNGAVSYTLAANTS